MDQQNPGNPTGDTGLNGDLGDFGLARSYSPVLNDAHWDFSDWFGGPDLDSDDFDDIFRVDGPDNQGNDQEGYQNMFGTYQANSASSQGSVQENDQSFVGDHESESASSQGGGQEDDQSFECDHQSDSGASQASDQGDDQSSVGDHQIDTPIGQGDVHSHDRSIFADDQIINEANGGDAQPNDKALQEGPRSDSASSTPDQRYDLAPQIRDQASLATNFQEEIDNMTAAGVYKAILPNQAQYCSESRISRELKEMKSAGIPVRQLSDVELQYWVGRLFLAFKNMEGIQDKKGKKGKPAQATERLMGNYYPDKVIEQACWRIVLDCSISANGIRLVEPHHGTKLEDCSSFERRMAKIVDFCKFSKAACKQLLDPPYHLRLIDAPGHEIFTKLSNQKINHKRDVQNAIGRSAMKKNKLKFDDDLEIVKDSDFEDLLESEDEYDAPESSLSRTPAKKSRVQPQPDESSPGLPLALKRKRRNISAKNYRQSDEDGSEDSDVSEYEEVDESNGDENSPSKRRAVESPSGLPATPTPLALALPRKSIVEKRQPGTLIVGTQSQAEPQVGSLSATPNGVDISPSGSLDAQKYADLAYAMVDKDESASVTTAATSNQVQDYMGSSAADPLQEVTASLASIDHHQASMSADAARQSHDSTISGTTSIAHQFQGALSSGASDQHHLFVGLPDTASQHQGSMSLDSIEQKNRAIAIANSYARLGTMSFNFNDGPFSPENPFAQAEARAQAQASAGAGSTAAPGYQFFAAPGSATQSPAPLAFNPAVQPQAFMAPVQGPQALRNPFGSDFYSTYFVVPGPDPSVTPPKYNVPEKASDNGDPTKMQYKLVLCEILNVHRSLMYHYTLEEFRMYGRAYNRQFWHDSWEITVDDGKKFKCKAHLLISPSNGTIAHFAMYCHNFAYLAICRGDLNPDTTFNESSPHVDGFATNGNHVFNMALGVIPNPLGMIDPLTLKPRNVSQVFPYGLS